MSRSMTISITMRTVVIAVAITLIVCAAIGAIIISQIVDKPDSKSEAQALVGRVEQLMFLPDEEPTVATITDKDKLSDKVTFGKTENGDKILAFAKAQKVIVYRPSSNKIVTVEPLVLDKQGSIYLNSKFAIYNGSGNTEPTDRFNKQILASYPNATIVSKEAAPRLFPKSIIVATAKGTSPLAEQIASVLDIEVGQLPLGMSADGADFILIIGEDKK